MLALESAGAAAPAADGGSPPPECATSDPNCDGVDSDCDGRLDEDYLPRCVFGGIALRCVEGRPAMVSCNDANACTRDSCSGGECRNVPTTCADDGNPCTAEACDPELGCTSIPMPGLACDDGDSCTESDQCDETGSCQPGAPAVVDDGNACTVDSCDPATGVAHTPAVGEACDDGNLCSEGDACDASGGCIGQPLAELDDGDTCTADSCDPETGAVSHEPLAPGASCSDGDDCNGEETCQGLTEVTIEVGALQSFHRTDSTDTTQPPDIVRLQEVGLGPGRLISLRTEGQYTAPVASTAYAVFSATSTFLDRSQFQRVPDAVQSTAPLTNTGTTFRQALTTNISQDFRVTATELTLEIPQGAHYLFLGYQDSWYADNRGTLQVVIHALNEECVQGEPQPDMCLPEE